MCFNSNPFSMMLLAKFSPGLKRKCKEFLFVLMSQRGINCKPLFIRIMTKHKANFQSFDGTDDD